MLLGAKLNLPDLQRAGNDRHLVDWLTRERAKALEVLVAAPVATVQGAQGTYRTLDSILEILEKARASRP